MTAPKNFADELERLLREFSAETNALKRFALGQQIDALLRNHAKEVAALVRAAEQMHRAVVYTSGISLEFADEQLTEALAALNKEKA